MPPTRELCSDDAIAFGRRLVPHGFEELPVAPPPGTFVWLGWDHELVDGAWRPLRRAWAAGEPTEPLLPLQPVESFSTLPGGLTAVDRFTA